MIALTEVRNSTNRKLFEYKYRSGVYMIVVYAKGIRSKIFLFPDGHIEGGDSEETIIEHREAAKTVKLKRRNSK